MKIYILNSELGLRMQLITLFKVKNAVCVLGKFPTLNVYSLKLFYIRNL